MLDHLPLPRNELQRLGHVLADLAQCHAAAARAGRGRRIDNALARQMLRQWSAGRTTPLERGHHNLLGRRWGCHLGRGFCLRRIRLQISELQFELIKRRATLRGLAEPLVPQLPDRELELLNQQRAVLRLALRRGRPLLCRLQAWRCAMMSACALARSVGSESSLLIANDGITSRCVCEPAIVP